MISLIVTDMDGTLLNEKGELPVDFDEVFQELKARNIRFAVASGRQYNRLLEQFAAYKQDMIFIAENGTLVACQGEIIDAAPIPTNTMIRLAEAAALLDDAMYLLCGKKGAYTKKTDNPHIPKYLPEVLEHFSKLTYVNHYDEIDDDLIKFSMCSYLGADEHLEPLFRDFSEELSIVVSGKHWIDIALPGVDKGSALRSLRTRFGIPRAEIMAFGDYLNDIQLLDEAGYSYAMANAHPDLAARARFRIGSNSENSVFRQIRHLLAHPKEYGML